MDTKDSARPETPKPGITGYRELSRAELDLINEIKAHAEATRDLVNRVQHHVNDQLAKPLPEGHAPHSQVTNPARCTPASRARRSRAWAALAQTELQTGYMMLVRAVARPSTF